MTTHAGPGASTPTTSEFGENLTTLLRDSKFYFEDGSITFRVGDVLFKVHASILKLQSENIETMLNGFPAQVGAQCRGHSCAETLIVVKNTKPSQFRNLMEIVYCPPPNKLAIIQPVADEASAWHNFVFYLDVAILSPHFDMFRLEEWALSGLKKLVHTASRMISDGIPLSEDSDWCSAEAAEGSTGMHGNGKGKKCEVNEGNRRYAGNNRTRVYEGRKPDDQIIHIIPAEHYPVFRLIDSIWHVDKISDALLSYKLRGIFYYHCANLPTDTVISLFRILGLRKRSPSLFGFLFLLLLSKGSETWERNAFTQTDRMAFFSAQSYLTPLPKSLKLSLQMPLLYPSDRFPNERRKLCCDSCYQDAFDCWVNNFDNGFYDRICSKEPLVAIKALTDIPRRRLDFAEQLKDSECEHRCQMDMMKALDRDLQEVYTRVSDYYQPIA